jgi:hypothetical protein
MKKLMLKLAVIGLMMGFLNVGFGQTTSQTSKTARTKKFIEMIAGTWKLKSIVDAESKGEKTDKNTESKNGTLATENPPSQANNAMEMLEFDPDARYTMNTSTTSVDSGSYRINEQHGILYLESDATGSPSEWKISIRNDVLTLGDTPTYMKKRRKV